jgi:predicted HAD superfamily Cof-like phosphohydrolase
MSLLQQAIEFRTAMEQPVGNANRQELAMQVALIDEEYEEFLDEDIQTGEPELKELADLVYVCFQYAAAIGYDLDTALDRVHQSNMSKLVDGKPIRNEAGKVLKGPNYQPPNLSDLV